jgi:hypothetical protein
MAWCRHSEIMKSFSRFIHIAVFTAMFFGISTVVPALHEPAAIKYLSGLFGVVTVLLMLFFRQLNTVTGVGTLSGREMERYTVMRGSIRRRFWTVLALSTVCSVIMWILSESAVAQAASWLPLAVGFILAVGLSYTLVVLAWINDLAAFADELRLREQRKQEKENVIKRLNDAKKA